jgi:hypothetical protein
MNERIKELAVECTFFTYGVNGELLYDGFNEEKFAELIVRECIGVIETKMPEFTCKEEYDNLIRKAGRLDAIDEIKEHFGVKE